MLTSCECFFDAASTSVWCSFSLVPNFLPVSQGVPYSKGEGREEREREEIAAEERGGESGKRRGRERNGGQDGAGDGTAPQRKFVDQPLLRWMYTVGGSAVVERGVDAGRSVGADTVARM